MYWQVLDSEGTKPQFIEHESHLCYGDMIRIHNPSIAEQLSMDVMGIMYIHRHRQHRFRMSNKSFKRNNFQ